MLKNLTVEEFAKETFSDSPAPGGGSIAALNAAMAASLLGMVANLTMGKKRFVEVEEEMKEIAASCATYRDEFVETIDRDANSFNGVMEAFQMPKETEEEKQARSAKIQEGYKAAIAVPLGLATKVVELYDLAQTLAKKGNENAITDVAVAVINIQAAVEGAFLNVDINRNSLKDEAYKQELEQKKHQIKASVEKNHSEIMKIVEEKLS